MVKKFMYNKQIRLIRKIRVKMKKIYEFPEVTVFNVGVTEQVIATSFQFSNNTGTGANEAVNSNYMDDDQATPWYRR